MSQLSQPAAPRPVRAGSDRIPSSWRQEGGWYFAVALLSFGFLAAVPFWHAYSQLRRPVLRTYALAYTAVDAFLVLLLAITPDAQAPGAQDSSLSAVGGFTAVAMMVVSGLHLRSVRREVFETPRAEPVTSDPAVARALAARQRRVEARRLWNSDRSLARELGIGRPDLERGFDDGGLFDLNGAPAVVLARVCGMTMQQAERVVEARTSRGGSYFNLGELFIDVPLSTPLQEVMSERALV
ncbi:helix-hairpin-helix domain-containing protein [Modestobacter muralis]|uniref:Helix-hairpin-helix domain-containing protein n=1 Tax=Modestobacter muralis TaxID=1608614 RepID=A0A6P0EPM8_9ACTN|nr:helix-hairpin-helix domain-containing protein [Modestobacter muralis]NEK92723.1 helix-hairpin-helix domain-containing protein [Modestobacter muralis]NEN49490.1 helix-hairpin-helix domain-containing protein [Modestobacter muralis]